MEEIKKQCNHWHEKHNEAAMGAFYTDPYHCQLIHNFLEFPKEKEVCCLEPSIGDATAILELTGDCPNSKIFGIEINETTCQKLKGNPCVPYLLQADFLEDVIISHKAFSFCFANPPYGYMQDRERYEIAFLKKVTPLLTTNAVMVLVVPEILFSMERFAALWCSSFQTRFMYRFLKEEYQKYHQIVLIGTVGKDTIEEFHARYQIIEDIPTDYQGERIPIRPSAESNVAKFSTRLFHPDAFRLALKSSPLHELVKKRFTVPEYGSATLGQPPVMPKDSHLYLLATCGFGQGLVGSKEKGDLHLQRGVVKQVKNLNYETIEKGEKESQCICVQTERAQIAYKIIESDGTITELA